MFKEALLGCSAVVGVGAIALSPNYAIAQSATIVRTGSVYADLALANAAIIKGDTINVAPGTLIINGTTGLHEAEFFIETDVTLNCTGSVGTGPGPSRGCVLTSDTTHSYSPSFIGGIAKGLLTIGRSGEYPKVKVDGFAFLNAIQVVCSKTTTCTDASFGSGLTADPGFLWQLGANGANAAGIRYQTGDLTVANSYFKNDQNGILTTPFIPGIGTIAVSNSTFEFDGSGGGTEHSMYIGRVAKFTLDGSTSRESYNGINVKCRARECSVNGSTIGSHSTLDFSGNQLQFPDGGRVDITNNLIIKGPNSAGQASGLGNPWIISYCGVVMPWATPAGQSYFHASGNTVLADIPAAGAHDNLYMWNACPNVGTTSTSGTYDLELTNNIFGGATQLSGVLAGLGHIGTGNVDGLGTAIATGLGTIPGLPSNAGGTFSPVVDFSGSVGAQSATITGGLVIGGTGALTVSSTTCSGCGVFFGPGGGTIWQNATATVGAPAFSFSDNRGTTSSFVFSKNPVFGWAFADGSTFTTSSSNAADNFLEVAGRNIVYNGCVPPAGTATAPSCGTTELKHGIASIIPSFTVNARGGGGDGGAGGLLFQSGTGYARGFAQGTDMQGYSDATSSFGPAVWDINQTYVPYSTRTYAAFTVTGTVAGQAYEVSGPSALGAMTMLSYSDESHQNIWYPGLGPWSITMQDDTVVYGASSATGLGLSDALRCSLYPSLSAAYVPGSGNGVAHPGCVSSIVEVIAGQGTGTLTLNASEPVMLVGFASTPAISSTISGTNETAVVAGGPTLVFTGFTGAINTTAPTGSGSMTLAMGSTQTVTVSSTTALTGMSATDTWAADFAGLSDLQLKPVSGTLVANGQTTLPGNTMTFLGTFADVGSILAASTWIAGQSNGSLVATAWDPAGVKRTGTKSIVATGATSNDMQLALVNGPFTIVPGGSVSVDIALSDQYAAGTAGTLSTTVSLQTNGAVIFHGTTESSGGSGALTFTVGESFTAMQSDLAALGYIGVSNPGLNDVISVSVTNQGAFSQTITVPIVSLPQADMTLTVPATDTATALILDNVGTLINISDGYAASQPGPGFIFTANTNGGTLFLNGTAKPSGILLNDTFSNVNSLIDQISFMGTQAKTATITWTATNQGGFSQSGTTIETVISQGTTNDTTISYPKQITITALGSVGFLGAAVTDLYGLTAAGPVTLLAASTSGKTLLNGATLSAGQTGTLVDTLPNVNSILASSFGYVAPGSVLCDSEVISFTNQGAFTTVKTISVNVTAAAFSLTGPSAGTVSANGTLSVPVTLKDTSAVSGNDSASISDTTGTIVIGGQVHAPPGTITIGAPPNVLAGFLANMKYVAAAGAGSDVLRVSATSVGGALSSTFTIPITVLASSGICPIPP